MRRFEGPRMTRKSGKLLGLSLFCALVLVLAACATTRPPAADQAPARDIDPAAPEYDPDVTGELHEAFLTLPGQTRPSLVSYQVIDGMAVMEGDIILGPVDAVSNALTSQSIGRSGSQFRWPGGIVPYHIRETFGPIMTQRINDAIDAWELDTDIVLVAIDPGSPPDDWVEFIPGSGCRSNVGRLGGRQGIVLSTNCQLGNIVHEIGHTVGLYHEHTREDRDDFVTILWENIVSNRKGNFRSKADKGFDIRPYDYGSIMHYGCSFFSRNGQMTIKPNDGSVGCAPDPTDPTALWIGQRNGLSEGDLAGVMTLYPRRAFWHQNVSGVPTSAGSGESFGRAVVAGDFDGDGFEDLAISVPYQGIDGNARAGAVHVFYGSATGIGAGRQQFWHQNSPGIGAQRAHRDDKFGWALAAGDFDGDGRDDLAIGVPFENLGSLLDAGVVHVLYGTGSGLSATGDQVFHQNTPGILGGSETGDRFGATLTAGDFNGDGRDDLAVGVPSEDVRTSGTIGNAGAVNVIYGASSGLSSSRNQIWIQQDVGLSEWHDGFGDALAAGDFDGDGFDDLAVGTPSEDVGSRQDAGAVHVLYGSASRLTAVGSQGLNQGRLGGSTEPGDRFGSSLTAGDFDGDGNDDLAIGVPSEDIGNLLNAGAVNVVYGTSGGLDLGGSQGFNQNLIGGQSEADDRFGWSLSTGDFDGDGIDDLAIGVSEEDLAGEIDAGGLVILYGSGTRLTSAGQQTWNQNREGAAHTAQTNDRFGFAMAAGDFDNDDRDDLAVGVPGEDIGGQNSSGAVNILYYFW